jgi:hypothetical protein
MDEEIAGLIAGTWLELDRSLDLDRDRQQRERRRNSLIEALATLVPDTDEWAVLGAQEELPVAVVLAEGALYRVGGSTSTGGFVVDVERLVLAEERPRVKVSERIGHDGADWRRHTWQFTFEHADPLTIETEEFTAAAVRDHTESFARALGAKVGWPLPG